MLGLAMIVDAVIGKGIEVVAPKYEKLLVQEHNEDIGVYRGKSKVKNLKKGLDLHKYPQNNLSVIRLEMDIEKDPIAIILGTPIVYITPDELRFLDTVEMWDDDCAVHCLAHIKSCQEVRSHVYNGGTI